MRKLTQTQIDDEAIRRAFRAASGILMKSTDDMAALLNISPSTLYRRLRNPGEMTLAEFRRLEAMMRGVGINWESIREGIRQ